VGGMRSLVRRLGLIRCNGVPLECCCWHTDAASASGDLQWIVCLLSDCWGGFWTHCRTLVSCLTLTHSHSSHRLTTGVGLLQGALHTTGDSRTSLLRSLLSPRHPSPLVVPSPLLVDFYFLPLIVYPSLAHFFNATSTSACQLTLPSCLHASLCTAAGEPYRVPCLQPA
jgi:hypothetical protein